MNKREFEIWVEGYAATGESGRAQKIGTGIGEDFNEAVRDYMRRNPNHGIEENWIVSKTLEKQRFHHWSIWACKLFDNEADARKGYG